jgi:adenylate kinase
MIVVVTGTPGAGKTTVLREAASECPEWRIVNWGDVMLRIAKQRGLAKDRDAMRKLPTETQHEVQLAAAEEISRMAGKIILDTHCSIATPRGYLPGLPFDALKRLKISAFVLVEAPVADLLRRRSEDKTRLRDAEAAEAIEQHQGINRAFACAYASFSNAPARILENRDGGLDEAVKELVALLGSFG